MPGVGPENVHSHHFQGDADAAGLRTTLREPVPSKIDCDTKIEVLDVIFEIFKLLVLK